MKTTDELLNEIECHIAQLPIPSEPENLYAPIRYTLAEGGKRLRPMLTMLSHQLYSDHYQHAIHAAAAVEIFHNFTLLHDDIMDHSAMRRGKPSVHVKWNENVAILSGDVMVVLAYRELAQSGAASLPRVLEVFNTMATQVCEGQQYDMDYETQPKVAVAEYMNMIELKTSVLLGGAAVIGALIGGAKGKHIPLIQKFAVEMGLAFQLQDDLLDTYGDEKLGKPIGGDILEGKQTFLKVVAISRAKGADREMLNSAHLNDNMAPADKIALVKGLYDKYDVRHHAEQLIEVKFERSLSMLDELVKEGVAAERVEPLREYAKSYMNRKK